MYFCGLIIISLVVSERCLSPEGMGLCDFADNFPCDYTGGSVCFQSPGCKTQTLSKTRKEYYPTTMKFPDNLSTSNIIISGSLGSSTTDHFTTDQLTTDLVIGTTPSCPSNMVFANCTICQRTCIHPEGCKGNCTEPGTCVCPNGLLLKGDDCIPDEECECFVKGQGVIPEGGMYTSSNCSRKCSCTGGQLNCDNDYQCNSNAVCEERDGLTQCYCRAGYSGDGVHCTIEIILTDCQDVHNRISTENGVYKVRPISWTGEPFGVYCNMADGGGWTVFQRRVNGSVDFNLNWSDYKQGFGNLAHEFWLGNDKLHILTNQRNYELRVDLVDRNDVPYYAKYRSFSIDDESNNYRLTLGSYSEGDAGNSLGYNNGRDFTTKDRDNDYYSINCATEFACPGECGGEKYQGAWWYHYCTYVALNDIYGACCFEWRQLPNNFYIKYSEMKLRPI